MGILAGSLIAAVIGFLFLRLVPASPARAESPAVASRR
jgi:hypothetical protein